MNHLPLPVNRRKPHTVVPALQFDTKLTQGYFGQGIFQESFSFKDFDSFCSTAWRRVVRRINNAGANERQDPGSGFRENLCYMQSWLFFGLLILVLRETGIKTSINDFVDSVKDKNGEQRTVLDTSRLPMLRPVWRTQVRFMREKERKQKYRYIREKLGMARELLRDMGYGDFVCDNEPHQPPIPVERIDALRTDKLGKKVHLSLILLEEWLLEGLESFQAFTPDNLDQNSSLLLRESMTRAGWCFSEIYAITESNSARYFMSRMDRTTLKRDHSRCIENEEDRENFFFPCKSENQDPGLYRSQHANYTDEQDCFDANGHFTSVNIVRQCVDDGYIPTLTVEGDEKDLVNVTVHRNRFSLDDSPQLSPDFQSFDQPFVCISHVWAE